MPLAGSDADRRSLTAASSPSTRNDGNDDNDGNDGHNRHDDHAHDDRRKRQGATRR